MIIKIDKYLELVDAVKRALKIERAAMEDLEKDYGVDLDIMWREEMVKSAEYSAIKSNIEVYEAALK